MIKQRLVILSFLISIMIISWGSLGCEKESYRNIRTIAQEEELTTKYIETGEYEKAIQCNQRIINNFPEGTHTLHALLSIASCYISKREYYKAIKVYQKVITKYPDHKMTEGAVYAIASCYEWAGEYEKAKETYRMIIENYPDSKWADNARKSIELINDPYHDKILKSMLTPPQKYDKLIKKYQKMVDRYPKGPKEVDALFKMVSCYFFKQDYEMTVKIGEQIIKEYPNHEKMPGVLTIMGICYIQLLDYEKSKESFKKVIEGYPDSDFAKLSQGFLRSFKNGKEREFLITKPDY